MITPAQVRAAQLNAKQPQTRNPGVWCRAFDAASGEDERNRHGADAADVDAEQH